MKKFIALIALTMVAALSCQKGPDAQQNNDLVGTKWVTSDFAYQLFYGGNPMMTYEFTDNSHVDIYTTDNGMVVDFDETTTYDYNYPKLIVHEHKTDGTDNAFEYEFKDKYTIVRVGQNEYASYMKFTKVLN